MRVLITGAGGFLGGNLAKFIAQEGCEVYTLGSKPISGYNHFFLDSPINKKLIHDAVSKVMPNLIFHCAGSTNQEAILDAFCVNTFYAAFILEALDDLGLSDKTKVMIIGTSAEYGHISEEQLPISEVLNPKPFNLYGKSKLAQTELSLIWQSNKNPLLVVRPFNIIGPGTPNHLVVGNFLQQINSMNQKGILRTGNLSTARDFIDIDDAVRIMWKLIHSDRSYGEVINLSRNQAVKIIDIVNYLIEESGKKIELISDKSRFRENDIPIHYGDNTKLLDIIGEFTFTDWNNTLKKTIDYHVA